MMSVMRKQWHVSLGSMAGLAMALSAWPSFGQDQAAKVATLKEQMRTGSVETCLPEAKKSGKVSDDVAATFCKCSVSFIDDLGDNEFLDLVNADAKKERPKNATYLKMLSKMESCGKAAVGG